MFATRARVRPCSARWNLSSLCRETRTWLSATATPMSGCTTRASLPFGPDTLTVPSVTLTSTPCGIGIGILPTRDISGSSPALPHEAQHFAADAGLAGVAIGHHTARGGQDRDPQPSADARHIRAARVDAEARPADALEARDDPLLALAVSQLDPDRLRRRLLGMVVRDEPFRLEDLHDLHFHPRRRDHDRVVPGDHSVADPREHVRDRIGNDSHSRHLTSSP